MPNLFNHTKSQEKRFNKTIAKGKFHLELLEILSTQADRLEKEINEEKKRLADGGEESDKLLKLYTKHENLLKSIRNSEEQVGEYYKKSIKEKFLKPKEVK